MCRLYDSEVDHWREFTEGQRWEELKTDRGATKNFVAPGKIWHHHHHPSIGDFLPKPLSCLYRKQQPEDA